MTKDLLTQTYILQQEDHLHEPINVGVTCVRMSEGWLRRTEIVMPEFWNLNHHHKTDSKGKNKVFIGKLTQVLPFSDNHSSSPRNSAGETHSRPIAQEIPSFRTCDWLPPSGVRGNSRLSDLGLAALR